MGTTRRRERERSELAALIAEAAFRMVEEAGDVSIRELADRIEYSPRTIYLYFRDKDAVLDAVRERGFDELGRALAAAERPGESPARRLRSLGAAYLSFAAERPRLFRTMFFRPPRKACRPVDGKPEYPSFSMLESAAASYFAGADADRVRSAAFALWSLVHGLASLMLFGQDADFGNIDAGAELERALETLLPEKGA